MSGFTGLSFPFRVGSKGRVVLSTTTDVDLAHIKESITQILLTQKGERVNEPEFGAGLKQMVFENFDETIVGVISYKIEEALSIWEPRIEVTNVHVISEENKIEILVNFRVITSLLESSTTVVVDREAS